MATKVVSYQEVLQMIREGADPEDVERVIADERTHVTDAQMAMLREELAAHEAVRS